MKRGFTLVEALVVLGIVLILAALLFPVFYPARWPATRSDCMSNLKQIGLAMLQYSQDYDERFVPLALINKTTPSRAPFPKPYGWADGICPYLRSAKLFQCPSERKTISSADATKSGFTDYWMNSNLARTKLETLISPAQTLLCGDGNDGTELTNARYHRKSLPQSWRDDENSPARRHLDTANYLFADGHVKAFPFKRITTTAPRSGEATFARSWKE